MANHLKERSNISKFTKSESFWFKRKGMHGTLLKITIYPYGPRTADCGLWTADCGLWTAACALRTADCGLQTGDYELGIKHGVRYKTPTKPYGLGIKHGLGYKTGTVD